MKLKRLMAALALGLGGLASHAAVLGQSAADTSFSGTADVSLSARSTSTSMEKETSSEMDGSSSALGVGKTFDESAREGDDKIFVDSERYAIVLAGLGVVGFLARRRRND